MRYILSPKAPYKGSFWAFYLPVRGCIKVDEDEKLENEQVEKEVKDTSENVVKDEDADTKDEIRENEFNSAEILTRLEDISKKYDEMNSKLDAFNRRFDVFATDARIIDTNGPEDLQEKFEVDKVPDYREFDLSI